MDNREFLNRMKHEILDYLPEQYQDAAVFLMKIRKNNDVMLDALAIRNKGERVIPQIYLKEWYEMYQNGMEMEEILKEIAQVYLSRTPKEADSVSDLLMDYHKAKEFLELKLVNKESNQKMLKGMICWDMENTDLTAVLCLCYQIENDNASTNIVTMHYLLRVRNYPVIVDAHILRRTKRPCPLFHCKPILNSCPHTAPRFQIICTYQKQTARHGQDCCQNTLTKTFAILFPGAIYTNILRICLCLPSILLKYQLSNPAL